MELFVTDLDGTLINSKREVPKKSLEILNKLIDEGVNFTVATARTPATAVEILQDLNLKLPVALMNGVLIYDTKELKYIDIKGIEKTFREQLRRLQTDYIDYYLMHMLTDTATWEKLKRLGIETWISEKLSSGQIRNIGFSYHGNSKMFKQLVDAYDWDFCQIQYNYMDETSQAGVEGLKYASGKGLPVIVMEPLRGGRLVNLLPESAKVLFSQSGESQTPAVLAFKWLYDQPEVTCVLSGMNSMEMVEENLKTASDSLPGCMTDSDRELLKLVKEEIQKTVKVGCTGCGYCMPCPKGVDIPGAFRCYNALYSEGKKSGRKDYLQCTAVRQNPSSASQCIQCGKCEVHCPQHIEIRKELKNAADELETLSYRFMKWAVHFFKLW